MSQSPVFPNPLEQKYIELLEKSNMELHKKRNLFHVRNLILYSFILAIAVAIGILVRNDYVTQKDLFENQLASTPFSKDKLLIQSSKGVYYDLHATGTKKWLSESGVLVQLNPKSIELISSGTIKLNKYNTTYTLHIPKNQKYDLTLLDGTKVKINENSTIHFKLQTNSNESNVDIKGEAYFEIAHQTEHSFIITSKEFNVEVFGTEFNIKNDPDPDKNSNAIALVKGSVKVSTQNEAVLMHPGDQVNYNYATRKLDKKNADFIEILKWNSKYLHFSDESLNSLTQKIGAWYGVTFEIQNQKLGKLSYTGKLKFDDGLIHFLEMLEYTDGIKSKVENDKVYLFK
jgi:hypothetical protein